MELTKKSLEILNQMFSETSNLQLPVAVAEQVIEIRNWIKQELIKE
jgi:hypothetical protein